MYLKSIEYSQHVGKPNAWSLERVDFGNVNLIVGKNTAGKTKLLNILKGVASLITGEQKLVFLSGNYRIIFDQDNKDVEYTLCYENQKVYQETLKKDGKSLLDRGLEGKGVIYAEKEGKNLEFQSPDNELACVTRRDSMQHSFFEDLHQWGQTTLHYEFASRMGQNNMAVFTKETIEENINLKQTNIVVGMLKKGLHKYPSKLKEAIIRDMGAVGYPIEDVGVAPLTTVKVQGPGAPASIHGIYVREKDISINTEQNEMSRGMFRSLSLIIQLAFAQLERIPSCILIDDVGEGLDFDRSTRLINLLVDKGNSTNIQFIMSTNDRFVMNNVPLEYWGVIQRLGQKCKIFNYRNSKKIFDEFKYTGLSNFDFLATEFYVKGFDEA